MQAEKAEKAVIQVVQGRYSKLLTYYCPGCKELHTIGVYQRDGEVRYQHTQGEEPYFKWNGSLTKPTIDGGYECIMFNKKKGKRDMPHVCS